jgi:hypothetical protein
MCKSAELHQHGCGHESGVWVFEEFEFASEVWGKATVTYDARFHRPDRRDDAILPFGTNRGEFEISDVNVKEVVVFDDNGDEMPLDGDSKLACEKMVLTAFAKQQYDITEFESGLL